MLAAQKLARLIEALRGGEALAASTAARQAVLAPARWMQRALTVQAAQERHHAAIAESASMMIGAQSRIPSRAPDVTAALRARLNRDLDAGNLLASFSGLQGVVEHLGEALLDQLGANAHPAGTLLHRLRLRVLAQERGHVLLGARCRAALCAPRDDDTLNEYCALGRATAVDLADLLDDARLDAAAFWRDVHSRLTQWHAESNATRQ